MKSSIFGRDEEFFKKNILVEIRNPILKCPFCKKKKQFIQFDLNCGTGEGYLKGNYARLYCCSKCSICIAKDTTELEAQIKKEMEK